MPPSRQTVATRAGSIAKPAAVRVRPVNGVALAVFRRLIARRRLRASFRAVRLAFADRLPAPSAPTSLVFYLNHPSWWDPLLSMVLAQRFIPGRNFYAPIDAEQLKRYAILRPLGLFPVQTGTLRGVAQFLQSAEAVLAQGDVLAITPQGAFTDVRARPAALKTGLGALLSRLEQRGEHVVIVPVALEYTFWNQRLPEALVAVGKPLATAPAGPARTADGWTTLLEQQLLAVQDELATLSKRRDESAFDVLLQGSVGTAGLYGWWQRLRGAEGDHERTAPEAELPSPK